ncbi:hypothetical protein HaLaN_04104 [Haematococcus lacustris]|uniref:Uncharacterized protein n=1 Tax=Haematococcus lacustris TaxID=44745 RepID=A0A699YG04_HAELA|nr:hypothetical protein HaLaN_04104 [Haematococcus lacustris]
MQVLIVSVYIGADQNSARMEIRVHFRHKVYAFSLSIQWVSGARWLDSLWRGRSACCPGRHACGLPLELYELVAGISLAQCLQRSGRVSPSTSRLRLKTDRGTDQRRGRVVLMDEHRTSRVSFAVSPVRAG